MKRYWDIKKNNMEKIIFWRFGDWYVVYYDDLTSCSKHLDLAITPFPGCP
jgi:DNA mismatch repair ATPase MutS